MNDRTSNPSDGAAWKRWYEELIAAVPTSRTEIGESGAPSAWMSDRVFRLWVILARFADRDGNCYPSIELLALLAGKKRRTIFEILVEGEGRAWTWDSHGADNGKSNLYHLIGFSQVRKSAPVRDSAPVRKNVADRCGNPSPKGAGIRTRTFPGNTSKEQGQGDIAVRHHHGKPDYPVIMGARRPAGGAGGNGHTRPMTAEGSGRSLASSGDERGGPEQGAGTLSDLDVLLPAGANTDQVERVLVAQGITPKRAAKFAVQAPVEVVRAALGRSWSYLGSAGNRGGYLATILQGEIKRHEQETRRDAAREKAAQACALAELEDQVRGWSDDQINAMSGRFWKNPAHRPTAAAIREDRVIRGDFVTRVMRANGTPTEAPREVV